MVQSSLPSVDRWMDAVDPARAPAIRHLRELCQDRLTGWEERMQWGMPGYGPAGADARVSFNSQKQYIALYVGADAIEHVAGRLGKADCGKGCVRYRRPEQIDFAVVADMLDEVRRRNQAQC